MDQQMEAWAREFGGDYKLHIFGVKFIVVPGYAEIRRILNLRPSIFKRGMSSNQLLWAAKEMGFYPAMFFDEGKEWGRSRRLISPHLSGHNVKHMLPLIAKMGDRLCDKLEARANANEVVEIKDMLERFTHDVIALSVFGLDVNSINATPDKPCISYEAMAVGSSTVAALTFQPMAIFGWKTLHSALPWIRRSLKHSSQLRDIVQGTMDSVRREANKSDGVTAPSEKGDGGPAVAAPGSEGISFGGALLRSIIRTRPGKNSSNRVPFSDEELITQLKSLFIAGTGTTSITLSWVMYYLTKQPKTFARCRAEARHAAPMSEGMASTSEQLSQLVFCSAVFKEAVRMKPPLSIMFFHASEDYTMKSGFQLEKGTSVLLLNRFASTSEDSFTRGAEFVPERWIDSEREEALLGKDEGGERNVRHVEEAFLSFGNGPRVCPGQEIAIAEAVTIIAAICARFDISFAPDQPDPPEDVMDFMTAPRSIMLKFTKREW